MKTLVALNDFLHSRLAANLSPTTLEWYQQKLGRFAASCLEVPKDPRPIEEFLASLSGSPETKHAYFRALKAFYLFLRKRHDFPNPIELIESPRCPRKVMATLEPHELMKLLYSASDLRERAIITLLVDTGMRTSEAAGLRKQDIKTTTVVVCGKTGEREIPISDETQRLLLTLHATHGKDEYVFHGHKGRLSRHGIYRIVCALMSKAGIQRPKLGAHRIRHAFGKGYLVNGGDLRSLQQIMGHTNITTTEKYAALTLDDTIKKHHQFTPLRAAHAAAQESFMDKMEAVKEAEAIVTKKKP